LPERAPAGGLERAVHELAKAQREIGLDASVVGSDRRDFPAGADILHAHDWYAQPFAQRYFDGGERGIVVTSHLPVRRGFTYRDTAHTWNEKLQMEARLFDLAAAIIAPSPFAAAFLSAEYGITSDRLHVIAHGVDARVFRPPAPSENLNATAHVVTAGRITAQKGVELFIRALPHVARHVAELRATIVGDGDSLPACERLAQRLGLAERITFRPAVAAEELAKLYGTATLFVMPSLFEPFGLAGLEALACGCPVLSIAPTGATYLSPGELAASCSPSRFARAIVTVLQSASKGDGYRAALRERALEWPWSRAAERSAELYAMVLR